MSTHYNSEEITIPKNQVLEMQDEIKRLQDEKRVAEWFREIQTITGSKRKFNTQSLESVFQSYSKIQQAVIIAISGRTVEQAIAEGLWVVETGI